MGSIFNQKENSRPATAAYRRNNIKIQQKPLQPIFYTLKGDDCSGKHFEQQNAMRDRLKLGNHKRVNIK